MRIISLAILWLALVNSELVAQESNVQTQEVALFSNAYMQNADAEEALFIKQYSQTFTAIEAALNAPINEVDSLCDEVKRMLEEIKTERMEDEILCLQALLASARIRVNPMERGLKYFTKSMELLDRAQGINAENPRVYFLKGTNVLHMPEEFGGGKTAALPYFKEAKALYDSNNSMEIIWGETETQGILESE